MTTPSGKRRSPEASSFCHPRAHEAFDLDLLLRALAHPCRREVLCHLDAQAEWTFEELAASMGDVEAVSSTLSGTEAETVLFHQHLPVLAEAGLVECDEAYRRIRRGENFEPIRAMVDAAVEAMQ